MNPDQHIEETLNKVRDIYNDVASQLNSLKSGEKIAATELARQVGIKYGLTGPQLDPTLLILINDKYPGIEVRRGSLGGIYKK